MSTLGLQSSGSWRRARRGSLAINAVNAFKYAVTLPYLDCSAPPADGSLVNRNWREKRAARIAAENALLPPPEDVQVWLQGRQAQDNDELTKEQGRRAVEWLVKVLLAAWCSARLRQAGRRLLAVRGFTANLRWMELWHQIPRAGAAAAADMPPAVLIDSCAERLQQLGRELEAYHVEQRLCQRLGKIKLPVHKRVCESTGGVAKQSLVVPTPPLGWHGQPTHRHEFTYMHVLLLLARAVNERFHEWCHHTLGEHVVELQLPAVKSYGRMRNKMFSQTDHRFRPTPRPQWNVDINRVLAVVPDPEALTAAVTALSNASGGLAKFKNGFALSKLDAAEVFHLRLLLASVVFELPKDGQQAWDKIRAGVLEHNEPLTYGDLAQSPYVQALWDNYAKEPPVAGEAGAQWDADVAAARAFLHDTSMAETPVCIIAEVQFVLPKTCESRHRMHELYKVARANTDTQLYLDFRPIADQEARERRQRFSSATPLRCACRDGDINAIAGILQESTEEEPLPERELDNTFRVACFHGHVRVLQMESFAPCLARVGWESADAMLFSASRPSLQALRYLLSTTADADFVSRQSDAKHKLGQGHTLLHTACRYGHTDAVRVLLDAGAEVDVQRERDGSTGVFLASQQGHTSCVELLLAAGANVRLCQHGTDASPLYAASEGGHSWIVEALIGANADVHHESNDLPPMLIAASGGFKDVVELLDTAACKSTQSPATLDLAAMARKIILINSLAVHRDTSSSSSSSSPARGDWRRHLSCCRGGRHRNNKVAPMPLASKQAEAAEAVIEKLKMRMMRRRRDSVLEIKGRVHLRGPPETAMFGATLLLESQMAAGQGPPMPAVVRSSTGRHMISMAASKEA